MNTTTQQGITRLRKQKAFAWAKYYQSINEQHIGNVGYYTTINNVMEEYELPTHLVNEFQELLKKLHKKIECPICLEIIDDLKITGCGHKFCGTCFQKIETCAICRKKIKKR